jgi:hypothetical protein
MIDNASQLINPKPEPEIVKTLNFFLLLITLDARVE